MDAPLVAFPIIVEIPVRWGDMDAFGHVNNTVFFRFFESARIEYLRAIAFVGGGEAVGPILASTHCRFRRPVRFPDTVRVGARTTAVAEDRFTMEYRLVSLALGEVAAEGGGVVVSYDYGTARKAPLPAPVRERIVALGVGGAEDAA
ncbi:MAG: acyl-CoA thioesterase [Gemmatimonadetes bacterium]|nr:acyl-CoA thioesterase [Gemmatimonadota bacterium]